MNSVLERTIQTLKRTAYRIAKERSDLTLLECLRLAAAGHNTRENVKGYSPNQWAFGAASGQMDEVAVLWDKPEMTLAKLEETRVIAEKAWQEERVADRISRAMNSRRKPQNNYQVGRWVEYWRNQGKRKKWKLRVLARTGPDSPHREKAELRRSREQHEPRR